MGRFRSGYSGYRGRRTLHDTLVKIAVVLAVLAALALLALFLGQRYIVFTDDGVRLELPFLQQEEPKRPEPGNVSVVVTPPVEKPQPQEPEKRQPAMAAVELPVQAVLDGSAGEKLEETGGNALILEMKSPDGRLHWSSAQGEAFGIQGEASAAETNEALTRWNQGETYTIARLCCFRDDLLPYQDNRAALRASYGNWRDELGLRWLDPDSQQARAYLTELCRELAELGFDEILLEQCAFPTQGRRETIVDQGSYASGDFAGTMDGFLTQLRQTLEPYGTVLSLRLEEGMLENGGAVSGLTGPVLEHGVDRLWLPENASDMGAMLADLGMTESEKRLVQVMDGLDPEALTPQAVLMGE